MWKTPWASSTSSLDDRGFTCQLVFIMLPRFVVYSTEFVSYVKYFPVAVVQFCFAVSESNHPQTQLGIRSGSERAPKHKQEAAPKVEASTLKKMT